MRRKGKGIGALLGLKTGFFEPEKAYSWPKIKNTQQWCVFFKIICV